MTEQPIEGQFSDLLRVSSQEFQELSAKLYDRMRAVKSWTELWNYVFHVKRQHRVAAAAIVCMFMAQLGAIKIPSEVKADEVRPVPS